MNALLSRRGLLVVAVVIASGTIAAAQRGQTSKVDVTGAWDLEVNTDAGGTTTPSVTLKQDGEKLTGHYSSATLGEADVTGTVKGNDVAFNFNASVQGTSVAVTYTGTVENNASMKGKISLTGLGEGTFTGKKKK
jgi:hypothetical protein